MDKYEEQDSPTTRQINVGTTVRAAGRDYLENSTFASTSVYLETVPEETINEMTAKNPWLFHRRFRFSSGNPDIRRQFIDMLTSLRLTDQEMKSLKRAHHVEVGSERVTLSPKVGVTRITQLYFLAWSVACSESIIQLNHSNAPSRKQLLGYAMVISIWLAGSWVIDKLGFEPARILKRIKA